MNFQHGRNREEPEINLIPMIDVLLVIIIFLAFVMTYQVRFTEKAIITTFGSADGGIPQTAAEWTRLGGKMGQYLFAMIGAVALAFLLARFLPGLCNNSHQASFW